MMISVAVLALAVCFCLGMTWDGYIDNMIDQSKDSSGQNHIDKGVMLRLQNGAVLTSSDNFYALGITSAEAVVVANCFKNKDFKDFQRGGVTIGGVKYRFSEAEKDQLVLAKKKGEGLVTLQASKTAIVIAHCPEGGQKGKAKTAVATIVEYLKRMDL